MNPVDPNSPIASAGQLRWYIVGQASWFASMGFQFVLFPFLVTTILHESPARVGIAQMSLMVPSLALMLIGGVTADRIDARRILLTAHMLAALPPFALAVIYSLDALTFSTMIVYGLAMGTLGAFAMPARDSALTRFAGTDMQRAVSMAMAAQFSSQLIGMIFIAGLSRLGVDLGLLLFGQAAIILAGAWAAFRLMPLAPHRDQTNGGKAHLELLDGLRAARASESVLLVVGLMFCVGLFYVGTFMVLLPLIVRDVYQGSASDFALVNIAFWGGTIAATFSILRFGHVQRRGRAMIISLSSGLVVLGLFSLTMPFWVLNLLCFIWGIGAGTTMTMSRTIVQLAPRPPIARAFSRCSSSDFPAAHRSVRCSWERWSACLAFMARRSFPPAS